MSEPVWVVDDDSSIRWVLEKALKSADIGCMSFDNPEDLLLQIETGSVPQVIISDVRMPQMNGMTLLSEIHQHYPDLPVIIMTAHSDLDSAVNAYQGGAFEYLPKPFDIDEALELTKRALEHAAETSRTRVSEVVDPSKEIIGEAPAMQEVFRAIGRLSRSSISVLINGQSGTGKELVAQALHKHSPRAKKTFVALNMAAIPADLIESELFGHEKGAFTGAQNARRGRFEQADGGTLFLDEIGDMPVEVQTRLLRVLADGQFNVRQLENTCRWLTVMASGQEILPNDLPPELTAVIEDYDTPTQEQDWTSMLGAWANKQLSLNKVNILDEAQIEFERVLLNCALKHTQGHKQDAAKKLGWGRNTLTRKLKELKMED